MLDLTYLITHKGRPVRTHGFDELPGEEKTQLSMTGPGLSACPAPFPLVVWRCTQSCNLACRHCYSYSTCAAAPDELSCEEARKLLENLRESGVAAINFSGGEPLVWHDLFPVARTAKSMGFDLILSTNGTLLSEYYAQSIKSIGFSHINISLAGVGTAGDEFRGFPGAFNWTRHGIKMAQNAGLKVVLRINLTHQNIQQLPLLINFIIENDIKTVVFIHVFPFGRGWKQVQPTLEETRAAINAILKATKELNAGFRYVRIFVAGNICDGAYLYQALVENGDKQAERVYQYLIAGAQQFGPAGAEPPCIDWAGNVYSNQFDLNKILGNIRLNKFSDIMLNAEAVAPHSPIWPNLRERCAQCRYVELCLNSAQPAGLSDEESRKSHPACYLTEAETHY